MPMNSFEPSMATAADFNTCRALLREGSKSFHMASLLLPARLQPSVHALYAFCRVADDAVDMVENSSGSDAVEKLRTRLDLVYRGIPRSSPVDRAFATTVFRHQLPRELMDALIEGFEWDATRKRYQTLSDVRAYAARVAATVGAMMTVLMDAACPAAITRACDLGVAMQLTNIARDIGEDARAGRLYLPLEWFVEAGIDPDSWLAAPYFAPAIADMVKRLLAEADVLYCRASAGIDLLPRDARTAIWAARFIYADIGAEIRRRDHDSVNGRSVVSKKRKIALLAKAVISSAVAHKASDELALAETAFLVEAASRLPASQLRGENGSKIVWILELFERLERAERARLRAEKATAGVA